jgi:hypothetical protein
VSLAGLCRGIPRAPGHVGDQSWPGSRATPGQRRSNMRRELLVAATLVLTLVSVFSATKAVIENWTRHAPGRRGIPSGWTAYTTFGGRPAYDFFVTEDEGHRALRLASQDEHSTIAMGGCAIPCGLVGRRRVRANRTEGRS